MSIIKGRREARARKGPFGIDLAAVDREIAPDDEMLEEPTEELYLRKGLAALEVIEAAVNCLPSTYPPPSIDRILDLPCGHGRVMRYLRAAFPRAELVACDVARDGVDYCAERWGAVPVYSSEHVSEIQLEGEFDLIWVGSLFTHLNRGAWREFIDLFESVLAETGVLVFTTHGRRAADLIRHEETDFALGEWRATRLLSQYERTGFAFQPYPDMDGYGISLAAPSVVMSEIQRRPGLRLVTFTEMGWASLQDTVSCVARRIENLILWEDTTEIGWQSRPRGGRTPDS